MNIPIPQSTNAVLQTLKPIIHALADVGATSYLVGGCVRDLILGRTTKDFDIELHGIVLELAEATLKKFGHVRCVGKKFGVLIIDGLPVDWSLPRTDSSGRKPTVTIDPSMSIEKALQRRDLTMNAMAINVTQLLSDVRLALTTQDIIDPYGGLNDLAQQCLCAVDAEFFLQDPLRFFRVMQFAARFEMAPAPALDKLCAGMNLYDVYDDRPLAQERIQDEVHKMLCLARRPSLGFAWLARIGRLNEVFPLFASVTDCEGLWAALDRAAQLDSYRDEDEKFIIMLAVLLFFARDVNGKGLTNNQHAIKTATLLAVSAREMDALASRSNDRVVAMKQCASLLAPVASLHQLLLLWQILGHEHVAACRVAAQAAGVLYAPEPAILTGQDLLDVMPPGPELGRALAAAYELQISCGVTDKAALRHEALRAIKH